MRIIGALAALPVLLAASGAQALCTYNGVDYAKPTLKQEFMDSRWVVRAKVLSAEDHFSDTRGPWTLYRLEIQHAYKRRPAELLRFVTERDSGGFYMDVGGDYLLFLNPLTPSPQRPAANKGAVFVNYSCGLSGPWADVARPAREQLSVLERSTR